MLKKKSGIAYLSDMYTQIVWTITKSMTLDVKKDCKVIIQFKKVIISVNIFAIGTESIENRTI